MNSFIHDTTDDGQPEDALVHPSPTPAALWAADAAQHALDELFSATIAYRNGKSFANLLRFMSGFRSYSPFNAMLLHIQRPGAQFVAPAHRWQRDYQRRVKPNALPMVILQPMGPVMFVFDVSDVEPDPNDLFVFPLPPEVERPFDARTGHIGSELDRTIRNAKRDGVRVAFSKHGSQAAGSICVMQEPGPMLLFEFGKGKEGEPNGELVRAKYDLILNSEVDRAGQYATLVHELAHLYCGHLGTPNPRWWPDRQGLTIDAREFEAEAVAHLLCRRLGVEIPSDRYLSGYLANDGTIPAISLECVVKAAGLIEAMGHKALKPRKKDE
jgi:hypothetical protein